MTVRAHCSERIRLLREAIYATMLGFDISPETYVRLAGVVAADDSLAATPPPGLPLAEAQARVLFCAWLVDRAHRWDPSSGIFSAVTELAEDALRGAPFDAHRHGELDDLLEECARREGLV